ncbi:sodium-coupled monocarboxylate transporter 1-like [Portunus trituberculatus]|uniref:sodium-coupled monocarboxylate transporter 1-like n=1 Tax=Portunus trituberculatus TaxID=210409 RepID=UPI001E1D012F|nr:sodium-coupled monocarboxylate transporter 1-like [Portunus trituberculatus]XP_045128261.1 sodium-coupled monocarboxylate transporter 1-like [Portunus trituberculatus]XP_045128262.1 sodium-coupled monocarboxylate transporter 1-like [Portunus trituberculatus]
MRHQFNIKEDGKLVGFTWADYVMFCGMLLLSLFIGVFYAYKNRKKANEEFLLGGRSMSCIPVSLSLVASYISAILVLGGPAETYYHNISWIVGMGGLAAIPVVAIVFLPFLYQMRITSVYEYLETRFDSRVIRRMASLMFVLQTLLYEAVAIYAPALALAAVTNMQVWVSILTVAAIASLYTAIGGMKAVVWTDVMQLLVILGGLFAIVVKGSIDMGGVENIWNTALQHNRTGYNIMKFEFDLYERHTVTNIVLGGFLASLCSFACSQTAVQRYSSMKSLNHARASLLLTIPFYMLLYFLAAFTGLVLFATYEGCDPLAAGLISSKDQILPFFVMDKLSSAPGLPGLFVACIFSGALSTISSAVSSQAAVTWEDWLAPIPYFASLAPTSQAAITKLIAGAYGTLAVGLAFLAGNFGGLLQTAHAFVGSVSGPLLSVFVLAFFMPFSNAIGGCVGLLLGTAAPLIVNFGASGLGLKPTLLPTSTDSCPLDLTIPETTRAPPPSLSDLDYPQKLFAISYKHTVTLGFLVAIVTGIITSLVTGRTRGKRVKRELLHPWVRWTEPDSKEVTARVEAHSYHNPAVSTRL